LKNSSLERSSNIGFPGFYFSGSTAFTIRAQVIACGGR